MATTRLTMFSTVLLTLLFRQSDPQTLRQFQQIERIGQILRQSSPINKKILRNLATTITDRESQRNKSRIAQFVHLRKLHGSNASERMKKILNQKNERFRLQNLRRGQLNSSKKFSLAMKVAATSQLLFLTTTAISPVQDKSNFDLKNNDLRSFRDEISTKSGQQTLISNIGISRGKNNISEILPFDEQDPEFIAFQDLQKNSGIVGKVSSQMAKTVEVQTSPTLTMKLLSQSSPSSIGPPGLSPPNDEIIKLLNGAQNFLALAESMQLKQHLKNATD
ncbi:Uncharacterized protein ACO02O_09520 [Dirofilaria immitis]